MGGLVERRRRGFIRALWRVPNRMLEARGDFLNDKGDGFIKKLAWARSAAGLVILAGVALTYPGFTKSSPELDTVTGHDSPDVAAVSKLADSWLYSILYGLAISLLCILAFAVLVVITARSRKRLLMLRRMCRPLIAAALFAGLIAIIVGTADLISWMLGPHDPQNAAGISGAETVIGVVLALVLLPVLAVWYVKAIYLAAVDVFRADDAHPLLAPFATTIVAWSLAGCALIAGGPTGVSYRLALLVVLTGPLSVSIINGVACGRLWLKYHDLLFRDGPLLPGQGTPRTAASASAHRPLVRLAAIAGTVMAIGPVALGLIVVGNHFLKVPRISGPVALRWSHLTGNYVSSPAVAGGTVYYGSEDSRVYALDAATGRLRWSYTTGGGVYAGPAVTGGIVYIGSDDGKLYALSATTGHLRWSYDTRYAVESTPALAGGTVYFGSWDHKVFALSAATGRLRWSYSAQDAVVSSPAVEGGTVYFGSFDDNVYALDAATGHLRWSYTTGSPVFSSPAVAGGTVYIGSEDHKVYALDAATGHLRWSYTTGSPVFSSPAVAGGTVYIGSEDHKVYALDAATGHLRWSYTTADYVDSSPVVAGGIVFVGSDDGRVYALDAASGRLRWYYTTGNSVISKPAVADNSVYTGSSDDTVYALNTDG
jgi:outer membrane protein assembly factor BamB